MSAVDLPVVSVFCIFSPVDGRDRAFVFGLAIWVDNMMERGNKLELKMMTMFLLNLVASFKNTAFSLLLS